MDFAGTFQSEFVTFMLKGFLLTLEVAGISILLSFAVGILIAILRYTKIPVLSQALFLWVECIRNLPLLLIIVFMYFGLDPFNISLTPKVAVIWALVIFESAMISEIVRSGLNSIDKGQTEAARSSGLTYVQTMRYILLPQALRRMIPPTVSQFISLLKDTSLATVIALPELMHSTSIVYAQHVSYVFPAILFAAFLYWAVNYPLSLVARRLEKRFTT
ncbi:glutamine ABC transporter permease [Tumebacillus avium]|uniref:Glutamine ABC transporter permease n=1 Tax=Tumebacillus avium TaxID=1903704 RepID=A0A1Y0IKQ8_9BACL|nr:amino acid ABC transporter permease [Tumebacillus avium]ARU60023.1 glutamine ABC transporter permease [Tumebacillus avium]